MMDSDIRQNDERMDLFLYTTSSAIVANFLNPFSLSSQATGPKILFPSGLRSLLIKATALSEKRMYVPSFLLTSFLTLTTTAHCTEPLSIFQVERDVLIAITTLSPTEATLDQLPLRTLITFQVLAQLLSAMITLDSCCIIGLSLKCKYMIVIRHSERSGAY